MATGTILTEEARRAILARRGEPSTLLVERGHVAHFAEAIGDPNPLFCDQQAASASRYGGLIAPPTFLRAVETRTPSPPELASLTSVLDGGSEWEYHEPVLVGDTITAVTHITSVRERVINVGPAVFLAGETLYSNQSGRTVARQRFTFIRY